MVHQIRERIPRVESDVCDSMIRQKHMTDMLEPNCGYFLTKCSPGIGLAIQLNPKSRSSSRSDGIVEYGGSTWIQQQLISSWLCSQQNLWRGIGRDNSGHFFNGDAIFARNIKKADT